MASSEGYFLVFQIWYCRSSISSKQGIDRYQTVRLFWQDHMDEHGPKHLVLKIINKVLNRNLKLASRVSLVFVSNTNFYNLKYMF